MLSPLHVETKKGLLRLGWAIRAVVVVVYIVWVVIGFYVLLHEGVNPAHLKYIASRDLPVGYQLRPNDFIFSPPVSMAQRYRLPPESDPVGKYLLQDRKKDVPFSLEDLSAAPVIKVSGDKSEHFFSLEKQMYLADILNTDSRVAVCATTCVIKDARVVSIVCNELSIKSGEKPPLKCFAVLELSTNESETISKRDKNGVPEPEYRLVRRGN